MKGRPKRTIREFLEDRASLRIKELASLVERGATVYDIGCDHGLVGLYALYTRDLTNVYLVDETKSIIDLLAKQLARGVPLSERIHLVHSRGEDLEDLEENATLILAGMGRATVESIVTALKGKGCLDGATLIVSPTVQMDLLERFLEKSGFSRIKRTDLTDRGVPYPIAVYSSS